MFDVQETGANRDWIAHYAAVKARISSRPAPTPPIAPLPKGFRIYLSPIGPRFNSAQPKETTTECAHRILREVSETTGITPQALMGSCRITVFVHARQCLFWRLRNETGWSLPRIGRFCDKDHTTILHGAVRHQERVQRAAEEARK